MLNKTKHWLWKKGLWKLNDRASYKVIQNHIAQMKLYTTNPHRIVLPYSLLKTAVGYLDHDPASQGLLEGNYSNNELATKIKKRANDYALSRAIKHAEKLCNEPS